MVFIMNYSKFLNIAKTVRDYYEIRTNVQNENGVIRSSPTRFLGI